MSEEAATWCVGERCRAQDRHGGWYDATLVESRGEGEALEFLVHFQGFNKRQREWISSPSGISRRLQRFGTGGHIEDNIYIVEALTGKRRKRAGQWQYEVTWEGFGDEENCFVFNEDGALDDMVAATFGPAAIGQTPTSAEPFSPAQPSPISPETAALFVGEWLDSVGRSCAMLLMRQREEFAVKKSDSIKPCPPWLYVAMHTALCNRAEGLAGELA